MDAQRRDGGAYQKRRTANVNRRRFTLRREESRGRPQRTMPVWERPQVQEVLPAPVETIRRAHLESRIASSRLD